MNCIFAKNPASGFAAQHGSMCAYVENGEDCITAAVAHAHFGFACLNVCQGHADKLAKRKDAVIEQETVTVRAA